MITSTFRQRHGARGRFVAALATVAALLLGADAGYALEFARHPADSATINAIEAKGGIEPGDSVALQAYMAKLPEKTSTVVYLNSVGGTFEEGLALGRLFHRMKIRTMVVGKGVVCSNACTTAFLGGRDAVSGEPWRAKGFTAMLGLDAFKIDWADKEYTAQEMSVAIARTQRMTLAMADYMTEVGAPLEILRASLKAPGSGVSYMSNDDALAFGVYVVNERSGELVAPGLKARPRR